MGRFALLLSVAVAAIACNPKSLKPNHCRDHSDCSDGKVCSLRTYTCMEPTDGPVESMPGRDGGDGGDGRDGGDASDVEVRPTCTAATCADGGLDGGSGVCEPDAGVCVECLMHGDCAGKPQTPVCQAMVCRECLVNGDCAGRPQKPICEAMMCRECRTDAECPADPGICMADGHCATSGEVMFVDYSATNCPGAGSQASPYCRVPLAMAALLSNRNVIVIRGPADDKLMLNTVNVLPVVIGRKNSSGADASIPAGAGTAILVSADQVLIRDLTVTGGTANTSKGIAVSGSSTALTLSNVRVSLGTGLGVQADAGATLTMRRCTVQNNVGVNGVGGGGILIDGANFDIRNTTVTGNGPGDDMGASWGGLRLKSLTAVTRKTLEFLTVMNNNQLGVSCTGMVDASGVSVSGSAGGVEISSSCGFNSCGTATSATCGAQP